MAEGKKLFGFLLCCSFVYLCIGCWQSQREPDITFKTYEGERIARPFSPIEVVSYNGKDSYRGHFEATEKQQRLAKVRERVLQSLAKRAGLENTSECRIRVSFRDWSPEDGSNVYQISQLVEQGQPLWQVIFITERLRSGYSEEDVLYAKAFVEVLLKNSAGDRFDNLPQWLREGISSYVLELGDWVQNHAIIQLLSREELHKYEVAEIITGVVSQRQLFPEVEGYYALVHLEERDKTATKRFIHGVLNIGHWEQQLFEASGLKLFSFQEQVKQFAIRHLSGRYLALIREYRRALGHYVKGEYLEAISRLQKILFRYEGKFIAGNLQFWIAMAHYRRKKFLESSQKFLDLLDNKRRFCYYLPLAQYRYATCLYKLRQLQKAIYAFLDFQSDYPDHSFHPSVSFFLGKCFLQRNERLRAVEHFSHVVDNYPQHKRYADSCEIMGDICLELFRLRQASVLYQNLRDDSQASVAQKEKARSALEKIVAIEQAQLPTDLVESLDHMTKRFVEGSMAIKEVILEEMALIGKITFPWIKQMLDSSSGNVLPMLLATCRKIGDPGGAPILMQILGKEPKLAKACLLTLVEIGVSPIDLQGMIDSYPMAEDVQEQANKALDAVLWRASPAILQQYPMLIQQLNKDETSQLQALETLSLQTDKEQISILMQLALKGKGQVKLKALQMLNLWHDPQTVEVLLELLHDQQSQIRIAALEGFDNIRQYPIIQLTRALDDEVVEVRVQALQTLSHSPSPERWYAMSKALADSDVGIRERARTLFLRGNPQETGSALTQVFCEENQSLQFYNIVSQILEKLAGRSLSYRPDMTVEERREIATRLQRWWQ